MFVNTRRLAERVTHYLEEQLGEGQVASHHGSLSRETRLRAEEQLKNGQLKAIVATASLELGIDIGYIDLVCQIGSPRSIATFLQRVGRAGHALGRVPKGRLFALTRDELLESLALVRAVRRGRLDRIEMPVAPLDILAQQIVAAVACDDWQEDELFAMCRRAWPYRDLSRGDFDEVVAMLSDGIAPGNRTGAYLHRDRINHRLAGAAVGADCGRDFRRRDSGNGRLSSRDRRRADICRHAQRRFCNRESGRQCVSAGKHFMADCVCARRRSDGARCARRTATVPFWLGEAPGRTAELSAELSELREELGRARDRNRSNEGASLACSMRPARMIGRRGKRLITLPRKRAAVDVISFAAQCGVRTVFR